MTEFKRLDEIAEIIMGQSPPGETYNTTGEGVPFFQGKAEFGKESPTPAKWCTAPTRFAEAGDILLSVRAPVGPTNIASEHCGIGRGLAAIRAKRDAIDNRFLRYSFKRFEAEIASKGVGSTFDAINKNDIVSLKLGVPPLPEQHRIVRILDEADALRQLRARADERMNDFIPALFDEMFGESIASLKKFPLGEVVNEFRYGTSNKSSDFGKPTLRIPNVVSQTIDLQDLKYVQLDEDEFERIQLIDGDMLFVRSNGNPDYIGRSAVFETEMIENAGYDSHNFAYASYLIRARLNLEKINPIFVQYYLTSPGGRVEVRKRARTSAGQYNINTEGLGIIPIVVPPLALQQQFAARVAQARELQAQQARSRRRLDDLFQSLLHRAFKGEL